MVQGVLHPLPQGDKFLAGFLIQLDADELLHPVAFQQGAHLQQIVDVLGGKHIDINTAVRFDDQQAIPAQAAQSLTDRGTADLEAVYKLQLFHLLSRFQFSVYDVLFKDLIDLFLNIASDWIWTGHDSFPSFALYYILSTILLQFAKQINIQLDLCAYSTIIP